jgi:competence protein ComEC
MAGTGNSYGHPHQETLDSLAKIGAKIYGTDVNGTIIINTDGETFTTKTQK